MATGIDELRDDVWNQYAESARSPMNEAGCCGCCEGSCCCDAEQCLELGSP